jgi:formylglycine-generating enzyme required for sulfatase activity
MEASKTSALLSGLLLAATLGIGGGCDRAGSGGAGSAAVEEPRLVPLTNMVRVTAGAFTRMGQQVTLTRAYWLGRFEVTQAEYVEVMGHNPSHFAGDLQRPVEKVTHVQATAFCVALTERERAAGRLPPGLVYRLPTEAEWEHACRAGTTNLFSFGDDPQLVDAHAWTEENSDGATHPVGQKRPNAWGFHDMHGNVWEWCQDWFAEYPAEAEMDPRGPRTGEYKVFRGGGWAHELKFARVANRFMMPPANGIYFVGFRVALGEEN